MQNRKIKKLKIVIAGGGTGGHLFPGIAIAEEFLKQNSKKNLLFVNTGNRLEKRVLNGLGYNFKTLEIEGFKGRKSIYKIRAFLKLPKAFIKSFLIIVKFKPDIVIGMGSYSSGPIILIASFLKIKTAICEQNIFAGITNRALSRVVKRVYLSFEETKNIKKSNKNIVSGNPVRDTIWQLGKIKKEFNENKITILVIGGSQGASSINKAMVEAIKTLDKNYFFIHQTGEKDREFVNRAYEKENHKKDVRAFFDNMEEVYAKVDIVVGRAGATTIAELITLEIPAIFIPYPFASDNHQFFNAKALCDNGCAEMILEKELSGEKLSDKIKKITQNRKFFDDIKSNFKNIKKENASKIIVQDIINL